MMPVVRGLDLTTLRVMPTDAELERFRSFCKAVPSGCVEWAGPMMWKGYGRFWFRGRFVRAHRFSFLLSGDIPDGMVLDHVCSNRRCVNPEHLEPVAPRENVMRSAIAPARINSDKTHCPRGHAYDDENTMVRKNGQRECRACGREETRRYTAKNRERINARRRARRAAQCQ